MMYVCEYKCEIDQEIKENTVLGYFSNYDKAKEFAIELYNKDPSNGYSQADVYLDKIKYEESKIDSLHNEIKIYKGVHFMYNNGQETNQYEVIKIHSICKLDDKDPDKEIDRIWY